MKKETLLKRDYTNRNEKVYAEPPPTPREKKDRLNLLSDYNAGYITQKELREGLAALKEESSVPSDST